MNCQSNMESQHLSELLAEGFQQVDEFVLRVDGEDLVVDFVGRGEKRAVEGMPSVYVWIACRESGSEAIYVGMASKGWLVRRRQHFQGLRLTDGAGAKNRLGILKEIQGQAIVKVLEKSAGAETHFGIKAPTHGAQEWALLARFKPKLNRQSDIKRAVQFDKDAS